jgi:hypothetical protein
MCIVHPLDLEGPAVFGCAQAGCQACLEALLEKHNGLIHAVLQQQARGGVRYEDLVQEGRMPFGRRSCTLTPIVVRPFPLMPGWPSSVVSGRPLPGKGGVHTPVEGREVSLLHRLWIRWPWRSVPGGKRVCARPWAKR